MGIHLRRSAANYVVAALILVLAGWFAHSEWGRFSRANAEGARSREIDHAVAKLRASLVDAETGQRGYLLTGESRYLEPYENALQVIPDELAAAQKVLEARQGSRSQYTRLRFLVGQKLAELRGTIELRRTQGAAAALAVVASDQGRRTMDEIRALCGEIQAAESAFQNKVSIEGEAAARATLLIIVMCSLVLLFAFALGHGPFQGGWNSKKPWPLTYGAAVLAAAAAALLRTALTPLVGATAVPFVMFFPAVVFAAWFGGVGPGAVSLTVSALVADYYFVSPAGSFRLTDSGDQMGLLVFLGAGTAVVLLSQSQRRAVERADRAQIAERGHRERLQTTLGSIGDAVIATDPEGKIVFANQIAQETLRASENELTGKGLETVFRTIHERPESGAAGPVNTVLIAQDGTELPIDYSFAPIRSGDEPVQGTVLVFRDMSEQRRAEAATRLLASIVESSADGIYSYDLVGEVTSWNRGAERMFGYSAAEMIGQSISKIMPPGSAAEEDYLERIYRGERIEQYDTVRRAKSGRLVNVSVSVSPIRDALGRITGASKVVRDVTERKLAEERFRLAVEAAPNGMVVTDENGIILLVNSAMEELFGYAPHEMIGQPVEVLVPGPLHGAHQKHREDFYAAPRVKVMGEGRDLAGRRKDGSLFPIHTSLSPLATVEGPRVLSAVVDMTERKRMEQERVEMAAKERALTTERALRETEKELARVARGLAVGELATSIAHEVNQPLAGVVTNAEAGLRWLGGDSPDLLEARESLRLIIRDGNRASEVIRRIRGFLKKESQPLTQLDLNEVVRESAALTAGELRKRGVELRMELGEVLPEVYGDRIQLQQVLLNLFMNGSEAMVSNSGSKQLLVRSWASESRVHVSVQDCGTGVSAEDLHRMFDAFFTTKPSGMGMGLSISRSIIEAHGGEIRAERNDGPGLLMQFHLPVANGGAV